MLNDPQKTHLNFAKDTETDDWIFSGRVTDYDLVRLTLDRLDRAVVAYHAETPADILQNLEIIFRRLGEQNAKAH